MLIKCKERGEREGSEEGWGERERKGEKERKGERGMCVM